jgi:hypothetical protein
LDQHGGHPSTSGTSSLSKAAYVDYNDGYLFFLDNVKIPGDNYGGNYSYTIFESNLYINEIEPLSDAVTCRTVIYVPNEVATNTDAPLLIRIIVPTSNGREVFAYKVR